MQIVDDDSYEGAAAEYQYQLISLLDFVLKNYKVPLEARQEICGEYAFGNSSEYFETDGS